jgi:hypothetical protein
MLEESQERVRELRDRIAKEVAVLADLEATLESPYLKGKARRAVSDCKEVDLMFLRTFDESTRTPFEEIQGLGCAEMIFQMAISERKQLQEVLKKYGPTVVVSPS